MLRLKTLENLGHVADLFHSLGYTRHLEQISDKVWTVARWKGYRITAAIAREPRSQAVAMAKTMMAHSRRSLAVVISPKKEMVIVAPRIGVPGVTRVLTIVLAAPTTFELHKLELLRPAEGITALAHSLRVAEVLDSEPAGDRFFTAFRVIFERMVVSRRDIPETEAHTLVLLSLVRMLFLYFVQAKGWLDGRYDYIHSLFDRSLQSRKHFHREVLGSLFFGSLNVPFGERSDNDFPEVPYLNGGLFEANPVEKRWPDFELSNEIWRDAFDELFERFQFCVSEARDIDSIAPDMLGRVFERLGERDREATGTYYTPEVIVQQVVESTLQTALQDREGIDARRARKCVAGKAETRDKSTLVFFLKNLKLLDPAVGSGAFLLGSLEALTRMWQSVSPESNLQGIQRQIIKNNLFGVDQSPIAVKLAELRLWLALVAQDPTTDIRKIEPLPNLNGVIRQGDTLIDPIAPLRAGFPNASNHRVSTVRDSVFSARGSGLADRMRALRKAEHDLASELLQKAIDAAEQKTSEIESLTDEKDLFGKPRTLQAKEQRQLEKYRTLKKEMVSELNEVRDGRIPFFSFEVHAPDVMKRGGFDVVVGNPPWVRAEKLSPELRETLRERFTWWRGSRDNGYAHLPDLSVAFLERAFQLTAPDGAIGFLVPSKLISSRYGEVARAHIVRESTITYLHRVPEHHSNKFGATTYPLAIITKVRKPHAQSKVEIGFTDSVKVPQKGFEETGPWLLQSNRSQLALSILKKRGVALRDLSAPRLGVKTGANEVFVGKKLEETGTTTIIRLGDDTVEVETAIVRNALRGRDIHRFETRNNQVILFPYHSTGRVLEKLPPHLAAYLERRRTALEARSDYRDEPFWSLFRTRPLQSAYLLVWADIAREPRAAVVKTGPASPIPLNSCYLCGFDNSIRAHCAAAVFNSVWVEVLGRTHADEARGGYRRFNARIAGTIPIPKNMASARRLAALSIRAHRNGSYDQNEIDEEVAKALDITEDTRTQLRSLSNC